MAAGIKQEAIINPYSIDTCTVLKNVQFIMLVFRFQSITFRKILMLLAMLSFFALGIGTVGLVAAKA